jgi:hypothetical protein
MPRLLASRLGYAMAAAIVAATTVSALAASRHAEPEPAAGMAERREVESARTDHSTTFQETDGTTTLEVSSGPIRVKRGDGTFDPIDTTLIFNGTSYVPSATPASTAFSNGNSTNLAKTGRDDKSLHFDWPTRLPKPFVAGEIATYRDAFPGGDVMLRALPTGYEQTVRLRVRPTKPIVVRIPLRTAGLSLTLTVNDELRLADSSGNVIALAPQPRMFSSDIDDQTGDPRRSSPIATRLLSLRLSVGLPGDVDDLGNV